jgi:signal transduction histidine kinase
MSAFEQRLLVLLPSKQDAGRIVRMLPLSKIECFVCSDLDMLCAEIRKGAGAALLTEEIILGDTDHRLEAALRQEPSWSKVPLIVITQQGFKAPHLPESAFLNITLVEKPVRFVTLRSVIESALQHRRHQYKIRDTLRDLKRAHEDLRIANRELENRVHERTQKLQETIGELEAFSYSISHDLRAPLRSMQGYAEVLLEDHGSRLDAEGIAFLTKISAGAARLDLLVQDVLAYSRVAKGHIDLEDVSFGDIVRDVMEAYPDLAEKATITISTPLPRVRGHPAYLTQCVSNLLGNAVKFVRPGVAPAVKIWAENGQDMDQARVYFEDNGIGIAPEHFQNIFEIFGRVNPASLYEGTGIGLAIVRKAAERMGGSVGVASEFGKGSRFWISLKKAK